MGAVQFCTRALHVVKMEVAFVAVVVTDSAFYF
jgi:hypothetical protein